MAFIRVRVVAYLKVIDDAPSASIIRFRVH